MATTGMAVPAPAPERPASLASVLLNVFIDPSAAFRTIASAPRVWFPMLLIILTAVGYMAAFSSRVGWENYMRNTIESNPKMQEMSSEQREQVIAMQVKFGSVAAYAAPPVMVVVTQCLMAAVLLFVFRHLLDATARFAPVLGVVSWSGLPGILYTGAALLVMFLQPDPTGFNLENPVGSNVGFYLPDSSPVWMRSLGSSLDVFTIWTVVLVAIGMSIVARKSFTASLGGVIVPWAIFLLVKTGWVAAFS